MKCKAKYKDEFRRHLETSHRVISSSPSQHQSMLILAQPRLGKGNFLYLLKGKGKDIQPLLRPHLWDYIRFVVGAAWLGKYSSTRLPSPSSRHKPHPLPWLVQPSLSTRSNRGSNKDQMILPFLLPDLDMLLYLPMDVHLRLLNWIAVKSSRAMEQRIISDLEVLMVIF